MLFVTGGAGFIGSNFIRQWLRDEREPVVNIDALTYAGNPENLGELGPPSYILSKTDICDTAAITSLFKTYKPRAILHFAAESHVDRSILGPEEFVRTNVIGTFSLLQASLEYWKSLESAPQQSFRFLHVSTDEVFGSLGPDDPAFNEETRYAPNSPYSASKAGSDHLVRAYFHTYGLPTLTTNCSNNYGPYQFPEKLIPLMVLNALAGKPLPVYGDGQNIRDWLFVDDHCAAIALVLKSGRLGETYNIGGNNEITNLDVVKEVCAILEDTVPRASKPYESQIIYVTDRPGHDRRYAIDAKKIQHELNWSPRETFSSGLAKTIAWYVANSTWCSNITSGVYRQWIDQNYQSRAAHVES